MIDTGQDLNLATAEHEREECRRTGGIRNPKKSPCSLSAPFSLFRKFSLSGKCEIKRWLWTTIGDESQAVLGQALSQLVGQERVRSAYCGCRVGNRPEVQGIWVGWVECVHEHGLISTEKEKGAQWQADGCWKSGLTKDRSQPCCPAGCSCGSEKLRKASLVAWLHQEEELAGLHKHQSRRTGWMSAYIQGTKVPCKFYCCFALKVRQQLLLLCRFCADEWENC